MSYISSLEHLGPPTMPITDPLRTLQYESGGLVQTCGACHWAARGHQRELVDCPACGSELSPCLAIVFGGLAVIRYSGDFELRDRHGNSVRIDAADCSEVVQFICRHAKDMRTGSAIQDLGPPRLVPYSEEISQMLWHRS